MIQTRMVGRRKVYQIDGVWDYLAPHARRLGILPETLAKRIKDGHPPQISPKMVRVVGGPHDGEWLTTRQIAELLPATVRWVQEKTTLKDGVKRFEWQIPDRQRQAAGKIGYRKMIATKPKEKRRKLRGGEVVFKDRGDRDLANFARMGW